MDFLIRDSRLEDMEQVFQLIQQLALFEKEPHAVTITKEDLIKDGFGENKLFHCFVAEAEGKIVGIALVYPRYSTWKGPVIHLEDLIVSESARGKGLGTALLDEVVKYGHQLGVRRISWEVLDWNDPAIDFYESKGANVMRDWNVVQMDETAISKYMENL